MQSALRHDPEYLDKIKDNVGRLKQEGLIRFACADTFSGEATYLRQIASGIFDVVYINYNFADHAAEDKVFPAASDMQMGVIAREAFMKGQLFKMADQMAFTDRGRLAQIALKWVLRQSAVTTVVVGTNNPAHLETNLAVADNTVLSPSELAVIALMKKSKIYQAYEKSKQRAFYPVS